MPRKPKSAGNSWACTRSVVVFLRVEEGWSWEKIQRKTGSKERTGTRWVQQWREDGRVENGVSSSHLHRTAYSHWIRRQKAQKEVYIRRLS